MEVLYIFAIRLLVWIQPPQYRFCIFWLLLAVKSDLMLVLQVSFSWLVDRSEHHHWPWCFKSVWILLFYCCDWKVGLEILSFGIKSFSSIRWHHSTMGMFKDTCFLCGSLSSILGPCYMVKIVILWLDKYPLRWISPFLQFLIKNRQPYLTDLHRHVTVGSLSLKPT
jgi:hypothetical protein